MIVAGGATGTWSTRAWIATAAAGQVVGVAHCKLTLPHTHPFLLHLGTSPSTQEACGAPTSSSRSWVRPRNRRPLALWHRFSLIGILVRICREVTQVRDLPTRVWALLADVVAAAAAGVRGTHRPSGDGRRQLAVSALVTGVRDGRSLVPGALG